MYKERAQSNSKQTITPGKSLISNMQDERSTALQKYLDIFVGERSLRSCCKIPHASRFSNSRIMLIWIIAALLTVSLS